MPREDERLVCEIHGSDVRLATNEVYKATLKFCCDDALVQPELHALPSLVRTSGFHETTATWV